MARKTVEQNQIIVSMERSDTVQGSQKTVALGQGVKVRTAKDRQGKTVVEAFFFDRDRYSNEKVDTWIEKHQSKIFESLHYIQMQAPAGSFENIAMRIQAALDSGDLFTGYVRVEFVFADRVIVCAPEKGDLYEVSYKDTGAEIQFGEPTLVELAIVQEKIKEFNRKTERHNRPNLQVEDEKVALKVREGTFDPAKKELTIVVIEAGANFSKKRYYPKDTLREAAEIFSGLKMYIDHPTDQEEQVKPERSIREWVSTITESWYEDGMVLGKVHIHSPWLLESMSDEVFCKEIGVSINAAGRMHIGEIDGHQMQIMDAITAAKSVDWVTEAGARGRVLQLMESAKLEQEHKEIENMNIKEFKEKHKGLYDEIVKEVKAAAGATQLTEAQIAEKVDAAVTKKLEEANGAADKSKKSEARKTRIKEVVSGSKIPEAHRERAIASIVSATESAKDEEFEGQLKEGVVSEIKYLNSLGLGKKIDVDGGHQGSGAAAIVESATDAILETAGLKEKKK